ncbi:DUF6056 family protein [Companilactobacillus metriopterae]|uniref:DUF6056 family protein n=1 Tax=Companilactobacillus metriopterae TaxID=1909267 RepID=UPI00100A2F2D|nr:DUF6056 family protein [Companilactobacillus metriopterae]
MYLSKKFEKFVFFIIFVYYSIVSFLIIPTGDDFFWWGKQGHYLLTHGFYSLDPSYGGSSNGRYLGNLSIILIMHSQIFAIIYYAFILTLFIWCIYQITGKTLPSLILSLSLFFIIQVGYLQSIFLWYAGFVNYLPPVTLMLLAIIIFKKYIDEEVKNKNLISSAMFVIALIGGLFVEHFTMYQLFVGIVAIISTIYFNKVGSLKKSLIPAVSYLLGAIFSTCIMFSNPSYYHNSSSYRETNFTINNSTNIFINYSHFWIITFNYFFIILICLSVVFIAYKEVINRKLKITLISLAIFFISYYLIINIFIHLNYRIDELSQIINFPFQIAIFDFTISILFYIYLFITTIILYNPSSKNNKYVLFYLFSSVALFVPFIFILSPVFAREYFGASIFLIIISIIYANRAFDYLDISLKYLFIGLATLSIILNSLSVIYMMTSNSIANTNRVTDSKFLYEDAILNKNVPYKSFVFLNDDLKMQSPEYYKFRSNFNIENYIYK